MSQFKKYLEIVAEGKDHVYNEESESIEKSVKKAENNLEKVLSHVQDVLAGKVEGRSGDLKSSDTKIIDDQLTNIRLMIEKGYTPSSDEMKMIKDLLKNPMLKELKVSPNIVTNVSYLKSAIEM